MSEVRLSFPIAPLFLGSCAALVGQRPGIKLGICGDPKSIHFCQRLGFDYVSCSPHRLHLRSEIRARKAAVLEECRRRRSEEPAIRRQA